MPRAKVKVETALRKKGFSLVQGDHHFFIYYTLEGKKTSIITKTSHTLKKKEVGDVLLAQMAKQCKITKQEFLELIDCSLSRQGYEEKLHDNKEL